MGAAARGEQGGSHWAASLGLASLRRDYRADALPDFLLVVGLKARWLVPTTLLTFALCALGWVADVQARHSD